MSIIEQKTFSHAHHCTCNEILVSSKCTVLCYKRNNTLLEELTTGRGVARCAMPNCASRVLVRGCSGGEGTNNLLNLILQNADEVMTVLVMGERLLRRLVEALSGHVAVTEFKGFSQSIDLRSKFADVEVATLQL